MNTQASAHSTVSHEPDQLRFVSHVGGHECRIDYILDDGFDGDVMTITHTFVAPELRGHGVAAELTRCALETAKASGWRVVPQCSYAALYVRRHPEYADLLPSPRTL